MIIGVILVVFSATVFLSAIKKELQAGAIKFIILQDWIWVIVSVGITVVQVFSLTKMGYILIIDVAIIVGVFAFLQGKYVRNMSEQLAGS